MYFFFFKQKTAYEMRISDWSSDVCSSDLPIGHAGQRAGIGTTRDHGIDACGVRAGTVFAQTGDGNQRPFARHDSGEAFLQHLHGAAFSAAHGPGDVGGGPPDWSPRMRAAGMFGRSMGGGRVVRLVVIREV